MSVDIENDGLIADELAKKTSEAVTTAISMLFAGGGANVSLTFCDNDHIRKLNQQYRNIDKETDVLSFPLLDFNIPGKVEYSQQDLNPETGELMFGDIVISVPKAKKQSQDYGHSLERELCYLAVHSVLHLLGYDHMVDDDKKLMRQKEEKILTELGLVR